VEVFCFYLWLYDTLRGHFLSYEISYWTTLRPIDGETLVIQYIQVIRSPNSSGTFSNVAESRPEQLKQPQIRTLPSQACAAGTMGAALHPLLFFFLF